MATDQNVNILINAKDNASKVFNELDGKLNAFGKSFGNVMKIAAVATAAAATAVVAFGVSTVKAFADSQAQMARFNTTVNNVAGTTKAMTDELLKSAHAAVNLGFSDETAANSLAQFYMRTKDVTQAINLNNIAMDLARAKNIDLADAGNMINLVLSGNGRALKAYGIELDETLTPLQALGKLHEIVKGQASAFADTIQGRLQILGEKWGDLKETIGGVFAPYVTKALEMVMVVVDKLSTIDFQGFFNKWKTAAVDFFTSFNEQFHIIEYFKELWGVVVEFFNTYLKPSWDGLLKVISDNKAFLLELISYFGKFIGVITAGAFIAALTILTTIFESLGAAIKWAKWFTDSLGEAFRDLATWVDKAFTSMAKFADKFGLGSLSKTLSGIGSSVANFFGGARADGGPVTGGTSYVVGERGPEIFTPGSNGTIIPNGGGGLTINISGNTLLDSNAGEKIAMQIMSALKGNLRI